MMDTEKSSRNSLEVRQENYGSPPQVVQLRQRELEALEPDEALIENQLATINPADLNLLEGKYGIKPPLPLVPGHDGVGIVSATGADVTDLKVGDRVIARARMGSWCSAYVAKEMELIKIPPTLSPHQSATLGVNPATAWRLLHDFVSLKPGDWVLQNGANTEVGRSVIQIAREKGWKTANIVRDMSCAQELTILGANVVITEDALLPQKCALALNCVGGPSVKKMLNGLEQGATLVTYGALSKQPMELGAGAFIFQDLTLRGFWRTRWVTQAPLREVREMYKMLADLAEKGLFHPRVAGEYPLTRITDALEHAIDPHRKGKVFLDCT